jgi:class 3 adenylate cyclase/pimeloyl-ACP methyl ester carboxylesterase
VTSVTATALLNSGGAPLAARLRLGKDSGVNPPRAQYAWNGDVAIAYGVVGDGPIDLVYIQGYVSDVEMMWECRQAAAFMERLASWSRLITIDRRGVGMSDRFSQHELPPLEDAAKDVLCVLDAVGSQKVALFGHNEGGQLCAMLAATHPGRIRSLSLYSTPISKRQQEIDQGNADEAITRDNAEWKKTFGTQAFEQDLFGFLSPSYLHDRDLYAFFSRLQRHAASPGSFAGFIDLLYGTDIGGILDAIAVPTQVLHRIGDRVNPVSWSQKLAASITDAALVELDGQDWWPFLGDANGLLDELERFVVGSPVGHAEARALGTVLFTDIVGSTQHTAMLGDAGWIELLGEHNRRVREELERFEGIEIDTAGDGFFATFDGPARAVRCAQAIGERLRDVGIEIRAGVHVGEIEHVGKDIRGIAVNIGARVAAMADPSEVLVSSTVKDLVAGSGLSFEDAGEHELKGVPDRWHVYRVDK